MHLLNRSRILALCLLFVGASIMSCKKEKDDLPIFGTCKAVPPKGTLSQVTAGEKYLYTSGAIKVAFDLTGQIIITHNDYPTFKYELWGVSDVTERFCGNHENLNGKHIKDKIGNTRTVLFPDGGKITIISENGYATPLKSIRIYGSNQVHHFNMVCRTLEYSSTDASIAKQLDDAEPDGETVTFEFSATGMFLVNIYNEDSPGNKIENRVLLGELIWASPSIVHDYYDDPRFGHT